MAQSKSKKKSSNKEIGEFLDMLMANQERVNEALAKIRSRNSKLSDLISEQMVESQRAALELTKAIATNPSALSENTKTMMDAAAKAQNQAIDFAKEMYNEQVDANETFRKSLQAVGENTREMTEAAMSVGRRMSEDNPLADFMKNNPMMDAWKKGLEGLRN